MLPTALNIILYYIILYYIILHQGTYTLSRKIVRNSSYLMYLCMKKKTCGI